MCGEERTGQAIRAHAEHRCVPLAPVIASAGNAVNVTGYLRAGSGAYARVVQAPGAVGLAIALNAGASALPDALAPRFAVIRIR